MFEFDSEEYNYKGLLLENGDLTLSLVHAHFFSSLERYTISVERFNP